MGIVVNGHFSNTAENRGLLGLGRWLPLLGWESVIGGHGTLSNITAESHGVRLGFLKKLNKR